MLVDMEIGMTIPQASTLEATLDVFASAQALGLHSLWFSQPPGGFDALMVLGLAAARTDGVRLGSAAIPTFPTHPLVAARSARTAAAAAPGRIVLGVGAGHRTWVEHEYGMTFSRPMTQVSEWVSTVRRLLHGEALAGSDNMFEISAAATEVESDVPIVVAGTGAGMLMAAGRMADGALTWMCDDAYLAEVVMPAVARGADEEGRVVAPPVIAGVLICVCDDGDRARATLAAPLATLGGFDSYRVALDHGEQLARQPIDVALIGNEHEVTKAFERLEAVGVSEAVGVVLADPDFPSDSLHRGWQLLAALASRGRSEERMPER
jgi:F420-dependent oxidoreductase-like protein